MQPCCLSVSAPGTLGNVHQHSIVQIFQSPAMEAIRDQMLSGSWPDACLACRNRESMGMRSYRQYSNESNYPHFQKLVNQRRSLAPKFRTIDVRLHNICNFKCRSCNGFASNRWFAEHNLVYPESPLTVKNQGFDRLRSFWDDFDQHILPDLESIHLAGGEPLITDAHYGSWRSLIAAGKTHVELRYDTNLSFLKFKHWDVVELWQHFPRLKVSMSLDGAGQQGEYIREGLDYRKWLENARRIQREVPHATRHLHFVVSIFNVVDFAAHYRAIVAENTVDPDRITLTFLDRPEYLSPQVLRPDLKLQAVAGLSGLAPVRTPAFRMRHEGRSRP